LLAAESDKLDGLPVNVGSGEGVSIRQVAEQISEALDIHIAPEVNNEFRPGEMRDLTSDTERIRGAGYAPQVDLATGIRRYLDWIRQQADVRDYFSEAANILRSKGIVHRVKSRGERGG
jgi:nucleoside-diphosphate-sugar epimerase